MSTPELLLSQVATALLVVALYHLWASRKKHPSPPILNPNPNLPLAATLTQVAPPAVVSPTPSVTAVAAPVADQVPPEILAVIAAAITVVLGQPHRVVSVQQAAAFPPPGNECLGPGRAYGTV